MQIVSDSACDLVQDYIIDPNVGFKIVSLSINIDGKEYIDDKNINIDEMIKKIDDYEGASHTSCPSPGDFYDAFMEEDETFCVTISSNLSGSYESAVLAANMAKEAGKKVYVVDSKAVAGSQVLLVDKLYDLIKSGLGFEEISKQIEDYKSHRSLLFMLDKFDNLIKNGRMGKLAGVIASLLSIKPIMAASEDGRISLMEKIIGAKRALRRFIDTLVDKIKITEKVIVITHCNALETAVRIKDEILNIYKDAKVKIVKTRGLTSFYAEKGGVIVSF